ncbi:MAG: hypothetical protein SF069_01535 [Phycisphaerae bacterium]|nr:hypothetical protein [Phycisphaerae bacterium]
MVSMGNVRRSRFALTALGAISASTPSALAAGAFYGIGDLPGGTFGSVITDISSDGRFVVGHSRTDPSHSNFVGTLFRWSVGGGLEDQGLGVLSSAGVIRGPQISADGAVIAGTFDTFGGFRHTVGGTTRFLGNSLLATDMSPNGEVIVGVAGGDVERAVRYRAQTNFVPEYLPGVGASAFEGAIGVSDDGSTVGFYAINEPTIGSSYRLRDGQPPQLLITGSALAPSPTEPLDVSPAGDALLGRAWRWSESAGLQNLPTGFEPTAFAADGLRILGMFQNRAAFLSEINEVVDVTTYLTNDFGIVLNGWRLTNVAGISDDGTVWAGNGINPQGFREGWVAVIPEPSSLSLLALTIVASIRRSR